MDWISPYLPYLIVCPLVGITGFVDAIAGGGGLISLPAYIIAGLPPHVAVATNKFSAFWGTLVATCRYGRKGFFSLRRTIAPIITALLGSYLGAELALLIPDGVFRIVLMVVIPLTALLVLTHKKIGSAKEPFSSRLTTLLAAIIAFVIGIYDGIYGPGTGTFLLLALVYIARMSLNHAAGVTKVINLSTNAAALIVFLCHGVVLLPLAIAASVFGIAGNYLGAGAFIGKGQKIVRPLIIIVMAILLGKIICEML